MASNQDKSAAAKEAKILLKKELESKRLEAEKQAKEDLKVYNVESGQFILMAAEPDSTSKKKPNPNPPIGIVALDETFIFVAKEYIDKRYKTVSIVKDMHLLNQKINKDDGQIILQVNENFNYGQFRLYKAQKDYFRWLVYHPSVISGKGVRKIFQHRFVENDYQKVSKLFIDSIGGGAAMVAKEIVPAVGKSGKLAKIAGSTIIDAISNIHGDYLRNFDTVPKEAVVAKAISLSEDEIGDQKVFNEARALGVAKTVVAINDRMAGDVDKAMQDGAGKVSVQDEDVFDTLDEGIIADLGTALSARLKNLDLSKGASGGYFGNGQPTQLRGAGNPAQKN